MRGVEPAPLHGEAEDLPVEALAPGEIADGDGEVAFYVLPRDDKAHASVTIPLYEWTNGKDVRYATEPSSLTLGALGLAAGARIG